MLHFIKTVLICAIFIQCQLFFGVWVVFLIKSSVSLSLCIELMGSLFDFVTAATALQNVLPGNTTITSSGLQQSQFSFEEVAPRGF